MLFKAEEMFVGPPFKDIVKIWWHYELTFLCDIKLTGVKHKIQISTRMS